MAIGNIDSVSSMLARMTPQQRQQFAVMHKDDPIMVSLAKFVNDVEQEKAQAMRNQQLMGRGPMPTVVDQEVMAMAPQPLPEEVGIGALPAPNMERMAGGGITGEDDGVEYYAPGGSTSSAKTRFLQEYSDVADQVSAETGIDRNLLLAQWGHETAWGTKTVGKYNLGNIKDVTGKGPTAVDKMEKSKASYKEYGSPQEFAADYTNLLKRNFPGALNTGSDVGAFTQGLQAGRTGAYATDPDYRQKIARTATALLPIGAAQAAPAAAPAPAAPTQAAPAGNMNQLEVLGKRVDETRAALKASKPAGLAALKTNPELAAKYEQLQRDAAEAQTAYESYAASIPELNRPAFAAPSATGRSVVTTPTPAVQQIAREVAAPDIAAQEARRQAAAAPATPPSAQDTSYDRAEMARFQRQAAMRRAEEQAPDLTKKEEAAVIDLAKKAAPEGKKQGFTAEDWIQLGLGLMAGQSPHALQNLGAAGLGVLKARQEARKEEREDVYRRALAREAEGKAKYYESGIQGTTAAMRAADTNFDNWFNTFKGTRDFMLMPEDQREAFVERKRQEFLREAFKTYNLPVPAGVGTAPTTTGNRLMFNPQTGKIE